MQRYFMGILWFGNDVMTRGTMKSCNTNPRDTVLNEENILVALTFVKTVFQKNDIRISKRYFYTLNWIVLHFNLKLKLFL